MKTGEELSKPSTELATFTPTPAMRIWLDTAIDMQSDSITDIANACQLSRAAWYEWLKVPGFEDWYYTNYKQQRRRWLPKLDAMGMANAKRDFNYWKEMKKAAGDGDESGGTKIQINNFIKGEKDKFNI